MAMICLNSYFLALVRVLDVYSTQPTETDEENAGFARGFGERKLR